MARGTTIGVVRASGQKYPEGTIIFNKGYQLLDGRYYTFDGTYKYKLEAVDLRPNPHIASWPAGT